RPRGCGARRHEPSLGTARCASGVVDGYLGGLHADPDLAAFGEREVADRRERDLRDDRELAVDRDPDAIALMIQRSRLPAPDVSRGSLRPMAMERDGPWVDQGKDIAVERLGALV